MQREKSFEVALSKREFLDSLAPTRLSVSKPVSDN